MIDCINGYFFYCLIFNGRIDWTERHWYVLRERKMCVSNFWNLSVMGIVLPRVCETVKTSFATRSQEARAIIIATFITFHQVERNHF